MLPIEQLNVGDLASQNRQNTSTLEIYLIWTDKIIKEIEMLNAVDLLELIQERLATIYLALLQLLQWRAGFVPWLKAAVLNCFLVILEPASCN
jgi:hypothetical protein